jgi:hypothetical protein
MGGRLRNHLPATCGLCCGGENDRGGGRGGGQRNDDVFLRADHGCEKGATAPVQGLCSFNGEVHSVQAPTAQGDGNVCGVDLPVIACMQHALLEGAQ